MLRRGLMIAVLCACSVPVLAQTPPPTRIRGTIAGLEGAAMRVVTREGPTVVVTLPDGLNPTTLKLLTIDAITANSYVGAVAAPAADGSLQAVYVAVLPDTLRGTADGHYDWDLAPGTSMTNATVTSAVQSTTGRKLAMVYKGQPIDIVVPPEAPIITSIPASRDDLKPGAKVFLTATKTGEGTYTAVRVTVGKDGVNPPN